MANLKQTIRSLKTAHGADLVLCYGTGDRNPQQFFAAAIASDTLDHFRELLKGGGRKNKILLAVMTLGGHLEAPWPLISLIREYCDELEFVVLEKSLSAGTLMALGADKIIMTPDSFISPIDPRKTKNDNGKITNIEVEDVIGYIDLIQDRIGTDSPEAARSVIDNLTKEIPPTELGSIYRTHALIRMLSEKMLNLHKTKLDSSRVKNIVENLTQQLFSHNHLISRAEAKNSIGFGDVIEYPDDPLTDKIQDLNKKLREIFESDSPFDPSSMLGDQESTEADSVRAVVSDGTAMYQYKVQIKVVKNQEDSNKPIVNFIDKGWNKE